ncbi:MAG: hypothetical protein RMX96_27560, partial [Nostoc sp. ChiSLP02]|nr:hypothetical protein [Nostoc sp. ChiSLP02]
QSSHLDIPVLPDSLSPRQLYRFTLRLIHLGGSDGYVGVSPSGASAVQALEAGEAGGARRMICINNFVK